MRDQPLETVTASEIADFFFCKESWRLNALGVTASNQPERERGTRHHRWKAVAERIAGGLIALGWWLILGVLSVLVALWAFRS